MVLETTKTLFAVWSGYFGWNFHPLQFETWFIGEIPPWVVFSLHLSRCQSMQVVFESTIHFFLELCSCDPSIMYLCLSILSWTWENYEYLNTKMSYFLCSWEIHRIIRLYAFFNWGSLGFSVWGSWSDGVSASILLMLYPAHFTLKPHNCIVKVRLHTNLWPGLGERRKQSKFA